MPEVLTLPPDAIPTQFHVRYAECDPMQVAHHANYYIWFEMARSTFCRERGIDYNQMERDGLFLPIVEARCRYLTSAHYDDALTLYAFVLERKRRTVRFGYILMRGEERLAEGETYQVLVDRDGRPRVWPKDIGARFTPSPQSN